MNSNKNFDDNLFSILGKDNVLLSSSMEEYTSFKVGGVADYLVTPNSYLEVLETIELCREYNKPYYIIGNGSNLVVRDGGFRGAIIKLSGLNKIYVDNERIRAQSGATLKRVSNIALENHLTGFEFASGIPGSVGGAVTMNAGAYDGEMSKVIESATIIDGDGNIKSLNQEELELGYRMSSILKNGYIVLESTFKLLKGDQEKIKHRINELSIRRRDRQPLEFPSAGSTFKRPEGHFAAKLIEDSGLKGVCVGKAEVSTKHSGFIINKGGATAKDVLDLIELVQNSVYDKYKVELHTEVRIIGEDK
ncbi:MAG: UDP-N-acetylmuramate dehydrogenase [Clostridiaceae bacterium]